jgi:hypothetical protein
MNKSRSMRWAWHVARKGVMRNAYKILVGKRDGQRQLRTSGLRRDDNIKMDFKAIEWKFVDWD